MNSLRDSLLLYAVTDRRGLGGRTLVSAVEEALRGGATMIQLREKELGREALIAEARALAPVCRRYGAPLIVNDDVEAAIACGADGVHVGQNDTSLAAARAALGPGKIVGVSARTVAQAIEAERGGADYLGVGAVFPTGTKADAERVSLGDLGRVARAVRIPVVAIGGIGVGNMGQLRGLGAAGAAVVSAVFSRPDIESAARELRAVAETAFR